MNIETKDTQWQTINQPCVGVAIRGSELFMGCVGFIRVYDLSGKTFCQRFGKEVLANWVNGLAIHKNTLLATECTSKLHVFTIDGKHNNSFTIDGMLDGRGMTIHNHKLFICDWLGCCVRVVDPDTGQLLKTIGGWKDHPRFIASADNRLYVTEFSNNKVKVMDEHGTFVDQFSVSYPTGIAISGKDIIVSECVKHQVSIYDKNHKFVKVLLECSRPDGVFITDRGRVIITAFDFKTYISSMADVNIDVVVFV